MGKATHPLWLLGKTKDRTPENTSGETSGLVMRSRMNMWNPLVQHGFTWVLGWSPKKAGYVRSVRLV